MYPIKFYVIKTICRRTVVDKRHILEFTVLEHLPVNHNALIDERLVAHHFAHVIKRLGRVGM